ncbi:MAG TPA: DUF5777 family beta-barrel protein [Mucilaginibacter sp.]|jgi:hypothetical protein|nr:DUF5777 family beta-barrel protein [Mucilaginibacter sp.]
MKQHIILLALLMTGVSAMAQNAGQQKNSTSADSLFNSMSADNKNEAAIIFESPRLILSQSTETINKKNLNLIFVHRFGDLAGKFGGGKTFFGLDNVADVYIGFQYGLTNNLNIEIGRSTIPTVGGLIDLEVKYAVLHQTNNGSSPIAITLIGQTGLRPYNTFTNFGDRISYFGEAIFARKFSHTFSFEIAPSIVQNNLPVPDLPGNPQAFFSASAAARLKVTKLMGIIIDYAHSFSSFRNGYGFSDPLGAGIQVVTGGHVFTLNISNARAVSEINYLSNTTSDFARGQYRLGFTISRTFDFNHQEKYNPKR